jgi:plasmid stabilization system protein ParE
MIVRIRDEAEADLEAAFDWYESRVPGLGQGFLDEFVAAVRAVAEAPNRWPVHPLVPDIRRYRLHRFPFSLAYRVEADHCMIYAIEALRRKPGYWRDRLR